MRFEEAAGLRDLIATVEEIEERQKMAAAEGDDVDIFAVLRRAAAGRASTCSTCATGRSWTAASSSGKTSTEFDEPEFFSSLLKQIYLDQQYVPADIHVPVEFEDREALEELLSEKRGRKVEIHTPQRGQKKAMLELVETNAKHSFDARFRVLKPSLAGDPGGAAGCAQPARARRRASSASTSRTSRAPTKWPAWWCGKTAG